MEETDILIKEQLERLPVAVQKALTTFDWKKEVKNISNEVLLNSGQARDLETEVLLLIYSFEPEENFYNNLVYKVGLAADIAEKTFDLIEQKVLQPLALEVERQEKNPSLVENVPQNKPEEAPVVVSAENNNPNNQTLEERKKVVSLPDYSNYESGKDPYREPIE